MDKNTNKEMLTQIARMESRIDLLESELSYMDAILVRCGFPEGVVTLKQTVEDLLEEEAEAHSQQENPNL